MRRAGWFVAGVVTATGALAAGEVARRRMRSAELDELPPAVGYEQAMAPAPDPVDMEAAAAAAPAPPVEPRADDPRADELRAQIARSRRRLHAKAREAAGDAGDDDEETQEH